MNHASARVLTAQPSSRLYLFGSFRVERDAQTVHFPTRKVEALLAYLALHPKPHPREKLATLLWGDSPDELARRSLRTALASLRQGLGDDILLADRETVQLNPDISLWFDVHEFELAATEDSQSAIALYQGDLLTDFYDDWILQERERLRALYITTLLQLAQDARSHSQYARTVEFAQKVLATDSANEKAYQHIIFCLAALGDRIGALKQYDECEKKLRDELGVEPAQETIALRDQIEQQLTGGKAREALLTNLPNSLTSFIGRINEIAEVKQLLKQYRLITLTGSGGCGKTRLAIEVAHHLVASFPNGIWWVDLAPLSDATLVPQTIAQSLGVQETPQQSLHETLINFLRAKRLLLILDNCEHLISACAQFADKLLSACPSLQILTTSREALGMLGELAWRVPSLALPDTDIVLPTEQLTQYDAVRLFAERAKVITANWKLGDQTLAVTHICRRLDGIPLAIELAAARLKVLSVDQIATRLDDRFNLLTSGSRTAPSRQQTLRATMDWSYDLLSDAERQLLQRLSVFAGGWTLEAAESVCNDRFSVVSERHSSNENWILNREILDLLTRLVDKSLVVVGEINGEARYQMLETMQQYAHEKLVESGEMELVQDRHLDYFLRLVEMIEPRLHGSEQVIWFNRLETENDNLRAALDKSLGEGGSRVEAGLHLAGALKWFWYFRGYGSEGRAWLDRVIGSSSTVSSVSKAARAKALAAAGWLTSWHKNPERSIIASEESFRLYHELGNLDGMGIALCSLANAALYREDYSRATTLAEESATLLQEVGDQTNLHWTLSILAQTAMRQGNYERSTQLYEQSLAVTRDLGDNISITDVILDLASLLELRGDYAEATQLIKEGLTRAREAHSTLYVALALTLLGQAALYQRQYDQVVVLCEESLGYFREVGTGTNISWAINLLALAASQMCEYAKAVMLFKEALQLNREWNYKQGIAENLAGLSAVMVGLGRLEPAAKLCSTVEALLELVGANLGPADREEYNRTVATMREQLASTAFDKWWAEGRAMTMEQAVAFALEQSTT